MTKRRWIVLGGVVLAGVVALGIGLGRDRRTADGDPDPSAAVASTGVSATPTPTAVVAGEPDRSTTDRDAATLRHPAAGSGTHRQAARDR